jgi:inner membrane protein involved in colicin E2 resistance
MTPVTTPYGQVRREVEVLKQQVRALSYAIAFLALAQVGLFVLWIFRR